MIRHKEFIISVPNEKHIQFAKEIEGLLKQAASEKSRGLNLKTRDYIAEKIRNEDAIIVTKEGKLAGFCYLRRRKKGRFVSISGIVLVPKFRNSGLAKVMIKEAFELARNKYPQAKIFSLTTSPSVMRINSEYGYKPINYARLSTSEAFWNGCNDCLNYQILKSNNYARCLCSAMLFNPFSFNIEDEHQLNELGVNDASILNNKQSRRVRTREIIRDHVISSQDDLLKLLRDDGFNVTQATLSRDLKKMNISKVAHPDHSFRYIIPEESLPKTKSDDRGFLSLEFSGNLVVIKTLEGYASPLAVLMDNNPCDLISGTMAGRDTIFVVLKEKNNDREKFKNYLNAILYGNEE